MKTILKWLGATLILLLCGLSVYAIFWTRQYQQLADSDPSVALSPDISELEYCTMEGIPLRMDLYFPAGVDAPYPLLLYVHGGSFTSGDKRKGSGVIDIPAMTGRGYAVAAINYRLMPDHPFPAGVLDAKCAIRFLRAHAADYRLEVEKIGIWGGSAGGHLAAMVGLTNGALAFERGEYLEYSSRVDAVTEMFGPTDLTRPMGWLQRWLLRRAFGTDSPNDPRLAEASPVGYVTGETPPFLILHGERDSAVPVEMAQTLYQELQAVGGQVSLVIVKNADHNFKPVGGAIEPARAEISNIMGDFFDETIITGEVQ